MTSKAIFLGKLEMTVLKLLLYTKNEKEGCCVSINENQE